MIKTILASAAVFTILQAAGIRVSAQTYPNPDFNNEPYAYRKDSNRLFRLEKESSEMQNKTGFGSASMYYSIDGNRAPVRLGNVDKISFVMWDGSAENKVPTRAKGDSMIRAAGMDPSMIAQMGMGGASQITLYKMEPSGSKRMIYLAKSGGFGFGHKNSTSEKYTVSTRKIRQGYVEMVLDKQLPKGEYAFVIPAMGMASGNGGAYLFCFGVD